MDEKDDTLPMDQTANPALVDEPQIQHELKAEPEPQAELVATEPEAKAEQPRGPDGKFASKNPETGVEPGEQPETVPPTADKGQLPQDVYAPLKAVRAENQELKQQIAALQQQFAQAQRQQEPVPEFWEDPQGFMARQLEQHTEQVIQRFQQQQQAERLTISEAAAKAKYADYGDAFGAFQQAVSANPSLIQQMTQSADPGEFVYKTGKSALALQQVGSLDELLKAERAKWEAEVKAAAPTPQPTFPTSTVSDGSAAARGGPVWSGETPLSGVLPMG